MVPKFLKVSKWSPFLLKRLTFALSVKSRLTPLEGVPRVSSSFFWIFLLFFLNFFYFEFFFQFFLKKSKNCYLLSCHRATWQWQSDVTVTVTRVSITPRVIFLVSIWSLYFNLSQFSPNFCKNRAILSLSKLKFLISV